MSYSLKSVFEVLRTTGNRPSDWSHDVEKSDVMSLGLTMIAICLLRSPGCLNDEATYRENQEKVFDELKEIGYDQRLIDLLKRMISFDESERPTFKQV